MFDCFCEPTDKIVLSNSVDTVFSLRPWPLFEVHAIRGDRGEVFGFYALDNAYLSDIRYRSNLPTEFFSHELADVDADDIDEMLAFMNEYGFVGHLATSYRGFERLCQYYDPYKESDIDAFESYFHFDWLNNDDLRFDEISPEFYHLLWQNLAEIEGTLRGSQESFSHFGDVHICGICSMGRARRVMAMWKRYAEVIKSLVVYNNLQDIACKFELSVEEVCRLIEETMEWENNNLVALSPTLGVFNESKEIELVPNLVQKTQGLEVALATQLWQFSLEAKGGYSICKECGQPFVRKHARKTKGSSRSTSLFCCDRCKNRYAQREYRKTPGYRLKQLGK